MGNRLHFVFVSFALFHCTNAASFQAKEIQTFRDQCVDDLQIDESVFYFRVTNPPNNREYKNFVFCFYKKQEFIREDGTVHRENIVDMLKQHYNEDVVVRLVNRCADGIRSKEPVENAYRLLRCLWWKIKDLDSF